MAQPNLLELALAQRRRGDRLSLATASRDQGKTAALEEHRKI